MATPSPLRAAPLQRNDWIHAGLEQLARDGIESVRVEVLARELAVSKGSFYWHFRDRDELLMQMLQHWETAQLEWLAGEESAGAEQPSAAIRWVHFVEQSAQPDRIRGELAVRTWARRDERVALRVADIERRRIGVVAGILSDVGFTAEAAQSWSEMACLVYLGWLDRAARDGEFRSAARGLGEFLSDLVLAASAKAAAANR
jgi:AcrR family transcriptional regulator